MLWQSFHNDHPLYVLTFAISLVNYTSIKHGKNNWGHCSSKGELYIGPTARQSQKIAGVSENWKKPKADTYIRDALFH